MLRTIIEITGEVLKVILPPLIQVVGFIIFASIMLKIVELIIKWITI